MKYTISLFTIFFLFCFVCLGSLAAESSEHAGWGWVETIGRWVNLLILFGLIYYFTREPISRFFRGRLQGIADEIEEAGKAREEAEAKLAAMQGRMEQLDAELAGLRAQARTEAEQERARIEEQASQEAERIVTAARREIDGLVRTAQQELRAYVAELSVELAGKQIQSQLDDRSREQIIDRFFVKLKTERGEQS